MAEFVIGIDGGGTKTRGVLARLNGEIIAHTVVGSTNYHAVGLEKVEQCLKQIIDQLAGDKRRDVGYLCLGLSGVGRPIDHERVGSVLERMQIKDKSYLTNDAVIALIGGALKEKGILVIAGTGSIVYGMDGKGNIARAGGYGQYLGDEGSGYMIGLKGLRAVMKSFDGRLPELPITKQITTTLNLESPMMLVTWIGGLTNIKEEVGKFAPLVLEASEKNDPVCKKIVAEEVVEIVEAIKAVVKKLDMAAGKETINVVMAGGVLENSEYYFRLLSEGIKKGIRKCEPIRPKAPAVIGAVMAAMKKLGAEPDQKVIQNLLSSWEKTPKA